MCNLYSMTSTREAIGKLFRVSSNRMASIEPKSAIFPCNDAPVVRPADDGERELIELSWGFMLPQKGLAPKRVTSVRDDKCAYRPSGGDRLTSGAVLSLLQAFRNRRHGLQRHGIGLL